MNLFKARRITGYLCLIGGIGAALLSWLSFGVLLIARLNGSYEGGPQALMGVGGMLLFGMAATFLFAVSILLHGWRSAWLGYAALFVFIIGAGFLLGASFFAMVKARFKTSLGSQAF